MEPNEVARYGKGAIRTPDEVKKTHYIFGATPRVVDWSKKYMVENGFTVPQRDQKSSSSCTAQATAYYAEAKDRIEDGSLTEYSARFIYSQTHMPGGGAYIASAMGIPVNKGLATSQSVPDGDSTEATMTDVSQNGNAVIADIAEKYAQIPKGSIDYLAGIVQDYNGFVTAFEGNNASATTIIQIPTSVDWGHCVWVCGFTLLPDGRKALIFKNSWTERWGENGYGYFTEDFINTNYFFDAYVYADIKDVIKPKMYTLQRDPLAKTEVYAIIGTTKRHIGNYYTLSQGKGVEWDYTDVASIPFADPTAFASLTEGAEIVFTPHD